MKVVLKIIKWLLILLIVLSVVAVGGLYGTLKYGLTGLVQQYVLPEVLTQTGMDAEVDHVELDLFKGMFDIKGLRVKNPAGFVEPNLMTVDNAEGMVQLKSLLKRDPIEVQRIKLQGAKLHIIRNREKVINLQQLQTELAQKLPQQPVEVEVPEAEAVPEAAQPEEMPEPTVAEAPAEAVTPPMPLPAVVLKALEADLAADYVDYADRALVKQGAVTVSVRGRNLATATVKDIPWGELYLISNINLDGHEFPANFNALIAPFDTPETLSFDLQGAPFEMDAALVNKMIKEVGIESEKVRLEVKLKARDGLIVEPDSVVGTELKGVTLDESVAGVALSTSSLKFFVPVSGTVMNPIVHWESALTGVLLDNRKVLMKEVGNQLIDKAIKPEEKAGIQALGKALGIDLGLTDEEKPAEETATTPKEEPQTQTEPEKEQTTEQKVLGGALRVLEESQKGDGEPEAKAVQEVLKIFGK